MACLYVFWIILMQVRSATLDTWLPEQIAFIQCKHHLLFGWGVFFNCSQVTSKLRYKVLKVILFVFSFSLLTAMGNEKSNSYWEAELPPNYDRVAIENFIRTKYDLTSCWVLLFWLVQNSPIVTLLFVLGLRFRVLIYARYQEKRWVRRDAKAISSSRVSEEKGSINRPGPGSNGWHAFTENIEHSSERKAVSPPITSNRVTTSKSIVPLAVEVSQQVGHCSLWVALNYLMVEYIVSSSWEA